MKSRTEQNRILIIDDNRPYVESLHRDAQRYGIALVHAGSLEEGRELFERRDGWSLAGIILDVKCLKEKNQQVPDNSFLTAAVRYFSEKAPHLPMVVMTGEPDQFRSLSELYSGTLRVFSKGRDEDVMLAFMRDEAGKLAYVRIVSTYPAVFEIVRSYLGSDAEQELLSCLSDMTSSEAPAIKNTLGCLRRLQERIYIALSRADEQWVPARYVTGEINLVACYKNMAEKGYVERYRIVDRFTELIYKITSDCGAHTSYAEPKYAPSSYTVHAVVFAMLDLLLWFGGMMEGKKTAPSP